MQTEQQPGNILRWVKASDDLPFLTDEEYHLRYPSVDGWERLTAFYDHSAKEFYTVESNCKMVYMPLDEFAGLEWLEEAEELSVPASPVTEIGEQGESPDIEQLINDIYDECQTDPWSAGLIRTWIEKYAESKASHPAPAPIVEEREDVSDINVVDIATAAIGEAFQKFQSLPFNFWNMDRVEYVLQRMGELMIEKMRILYANNKRNL